MKVKLKGENYDIIIWLNLTILEVKNYQHCLFRGVIFFENKFQMAPCRPISENYKQIMNYGMVKG